MVPIRSVFWRQLGPSTDLRELSVRIALQCRGCGCQVGGQVGACLERTSRRHLLDALEQGLANASGFLLGENETLLCPLRISAPFSLSRGRRYSRGQTPGGISCRVWVRIRGQQQ